MKDSFYPRSVAAVLTTTATEIYTTPPLFNGEVISILTTNTTNANADVTIEWYNSADNTWYALLYLHPLAGYGHYQLKDSLFLQSGSKIRATSSSHSAVTITIHIKEYFRQNNV